jgi:hypothetical protein
MFAYKIDFFCMEPKPLGLDRTEGTNDQIEQRNALTFARHPIGSTDNQLFAMLTNTNQLSALLTNAIHHIPPFGSER